MKETNLKRPAHYYVYPLGRDGRQPELAPPPADPSPACPGVRQVVPLAAIFAAFGRPDGQPSPGRRSS